MSGIGANREKLEGVRATTVADVSELTADELIRQGERLLKLGRDLLAQAAHLRALEGLPEERSTGRFGIVTEKEAIFTAKRLTKFTRAEYAEALGLGASGAARWLAKLLDREDAVIERVVDEHGSHYRYIDPAPVSELRAKRPQRSAEERANRAAGGAGGVAGTGGDLRGVPKAVRPVVRQAMNEGWVLSRQAGGKGHFQLTRNGKSVGFGGTPTDADATARNLRRQLYSGRAHLQRTVSRNGSA